MAQEAIAALAEEIKKLRESQEEMSRKVGRSGGRKDSYRFKRKQMRSSISSTRR